MLFRSLRLSSARRVLIITLEDLSSSNLFSRLTISPAHWLLSLFSNDAKLGRVVSGKDVVDTNGISCYLSEYQIIKIPLKNLI